MGSQWVKKHDISLAPKTTWPATSPSPKRLSLGEDSKTTRALVSGIVRPSFPAITLEASGRASGRRHESDAGIMPAAHREQPPLKLANHSQKRRKS
jgi:hypothetical protein